MQNKIKIVKLTLVFMFIATVFFAQEAQKPHKIIVGVHAAPMGSIWWGNYTSRRQYDIHYRPIIGFNGGASIQYQISNKISLLAELNFDRKGNRTIAYNLKKDELSSEFGTYQSDVFTDYISLPILMKFKLNNKKVGFYANVGSYLGYLINYEYTTSFLDTYSKRKANLNNRHRFDFGLITGLGWDIPIKARFQFSIEFRNTLGGLGRAKGNNIFSAVKNESLALLLGLAYKLK